MKQEKLNTFSLSIYIPLFESQPLKEKQNKNNLFYTNLHVFKLLLSIFHRQTQQHTKASSNGTYWISTNCMGIVLRS